jgi:hypothetical protein
MNAVLLIMAMVFLVIVFPLALISTGGSMLRLPKGFFEKHRVTTGFHVSSIIVGIVLGLAFDSVELLAVSLYFTLAVNTFVLSICAKGDNPPVVLYNIYVVFFWFAVIVWIPASLGL